MPMYGSVAAQVKVHVCELGLTPPRLNGGPDCDDSAHEGGMPNVALYVNLTFTSK